MKAGSGGPGVPGIYPVIYDENRDEVIAGSGKAGNICIRNPWPGIMQTIWGDRDRFVSQYYRKYCNNLDSEHCHDWAYCASDGAVLAGDGDFRILGREDDDSNGAGPPRGSKGTECA